MTNGKTQVQVAAWWSQPCSVREWTEFFPLLVTSDVALADLFKGLPTTDRPDRSRAAGCLAALAASAGGVQRPDAAAQARTVLDAWAKRAAAYVAKDQYPAEDREEAS